MPITRLNHAVLFVGDAERSARFYTEVLGFRRTSVEIPGAVFLQASGSTNDHDLGLFSVGDRRGDGPPTRRSGVGLYHLAWEVDTLDELERIAQALAAAGALTGASDHGTTKALYGRDPDGIEFEVSWLVPASLIEDGAVEARGRIRPLDLAQERSRYGGDTPGGLGVSQPTRSGGEALPAEVHC
ncbi:MAG: VOC family protein [Actinomycetota bacterium]|nr:VOC family protein [Actinomycetota bacterium]